MIKKYRERLTEVKAVRWTGDNLEEIKTLCGPVDDLGPTHAGTEKIFHQIVVKNLTSNLLIELGDMVMKDLRTGKFLTMNPVLFKQLYEELEE